VTGAPVATPPPGVEWTECLIPPAPVTPALRAEVQARTGVVPGWLARVAPSPWMVRMMSELMTKPVAFAPGHLCDLVSLVVSQDNSCRYCYGVQRAVLKIQGYGDAYLDRLQGDFQAPDLTPAERGALDLARRISRGQPRPGRDEFDAVVAAGLDRRAMAEIVAIAAAGNFFNRVASLLALPPEDLEKMLTHRLFRFVRPFVAWRMRSFRPAPESLGDPKDVLWSRVVAALEPSPVAGVARRAIDGALASPVLPRRTKGLMLAVIARALGCVQGESECRTLLAGEGLGAEVVDDTLATLSSPRLDARERRLVPFARETVRYQPAVIQERMREVCAGFTPEETLETAGIAALGNAVCRLSVLLDAC
jgi:alkylhydroperoxidase family enzyme